jgi:hypothetical protein
MHRALIATIAAIAYAGLAPLEFQPANEVEWIDPGPGLRFEGRGIAHSTAALHWERSPHPGEVSVELWVVPADEPDDRLGQIFAFFDGRAVEPLLIAQWKSGLVVRTRVDDGRGRRRYRELGSLGLLFRDQERFVAVASAATGTAVFLDGRELEQRTSLSLIPAGEKFSGRIVFGNSAAGTAPWRGDLLGAAVYRRALTPAEIAEHHVRVRDGGVSSLAEEDGLTALYAFEGRTGEAAHSRAATGPSLQVPLRFERLRKQTLQLPRWRTRPSGAFGRDVLLNLLAFMPLGFFAVAAGRKRSRGIATRNVLVGAVLLGGVLSLGIELIQVELPARVSSATDVASNLLGTIAGAAFAWRGPLAARLWPGGR